MRKLARSRIVGPLAPYADEFRAELDRLGYTSWSREYKINQVGRLSRWIEGQHLTIGDLDDVRLAAFFSSMATATHRPPTRVAFAPLLNVLIAHGAMARPGAVMMDSPLDALISDYRRWMIHERGLADRTIGRYEVTARRFLGQRVAASGGNGTEQLTGDAVVGFLLAEAGRGLRPGSVQGRVAELRSLLRYLYLKGFTQIPLAQSVPAVPGWKDGSVPPRLSMAQVRALLDSCDPDTASGLRDIAMLSLMARLGLRAAEVAWLGLDDLLWRAGELVVRGKGRREDHLPLPGDVGEALTHYLTHARPDAQVRNVFLTLYAPPRALRPTAVGQMVWRQSRRAGLPPMRAHCLRHALASHLLDRGARLPEIAQLLRQRDLATTAGYAKIDYAALRELALPWPGTSR